MHKATTPLAGRHRHGRQPHAKSLWILLGFNSPGPPIAGLGPEGRALARSVNEEVALLTKSDALTGCCGFFASLPDWRDVRGAIEEIDWVFGQQREALGVVIMTTYGDKCPGDPTFRPIWEKLNSYRALVFMHPTEFDITPERLGSFLPQAVVDYPIATTRAAVDIVVSGTLRACPHIDIILSHGGGALPFLMQRAFGSLAIPAFEQRAGMSANEAFADAKRFYYDLALATSPAQLHGLLSVADPSHILFGSDHPYAPKELVFQSLEAYNNFVHRYPGEAALSPSTLVRNSYNLLSAHASTNSPKLPGDP